MPLTPPTTEPAKVRAGDTWNWTKSLSDYPASAWDLAYSLKLNGSDAATVIAATAAGPGGDDFAVTLRAGLSGAIPAGIYRWIARVTEKGTFMPPSYARVFTVGEGFLTVEADPATASNDLRSHEQIVYEKCKTIIAGRADADVSRYTIGNRTLDKIPVPELIAFVDRYEKRFKAEMRQSAIDNGGRNPTNIRVTFRRPR